MDNMKYVAAEDEGQGLYLWLGVKFMDDATFMKMEELEEEEGEKKKLMLEVVETEEAPPEDEEDWADQPATECSLWDWMERFDCDSPLSPQKPKPLSDMTDNEMLNFITWLIQHEIGYDILKIIIRIGLGEIK